MVILFHTGEDGLHASTPARGLSQYLAGTGVLLLDHSGRAEGERAGAE